MALSVIQQSWESSVRGLIRDIKAAVRRAVNTALVIIFIVVGGSALIEIWPEINEFISQGCETELCCQECTSVPITRIIDGDTFVSDRGRVRLYGMDTPELGQRCAHEATERMRELASGAVRIEEGPRTRDRYGRLLYYAYTQSDDSIDGLLVREGLARAWTDDGQHRDYLMSVEADARQAGTGCLWWPARESAGRPGSSGRPGYLIAIPPETTMVSPVMYEASGLARKATTFETSSG